MCLCLCVLAGGGGGEGAGAVVEGVEGVLSRGVGIFS